MAMMADKSHPLWQSFLCTFVPRDEVHPAANLTRDWCKPRGKNNEQIQ